MKKRKKAQILTIFTISCVWLAFGLSYLKKPDPISLQYPVEVLNKYLSPLKESSKCTSLLNMNKLLENQSFEVLDFSQNRALYSGRVLGGDSQLAFESEILSTALDVSIIETNTFIRTNDDKKKLIFSIHTIITDSLKKPRCIVKYKQLF